MAITSDAKAETSIEQRNMELMQTLDGAWNAQDLDTFAKRHKDDTVVRWPGQPATHGVAAHRAEAIAFFKTFPDQHLDNRPYKVLIARGDWTCSVAHFTGSMTGPMTGADGTVIPRNIRLAEAPSFGKPILMYDVQSVGAKSYLSVAQELLRRAESGELSAEAELPRAAVQEAGEVGS